MTHCSIWLNRYLISTLHFWIWVLDFSHFETSFGLLNIFLDFYFWLTGRWDICWDDSHILSHVFVKSILGSVTFEREPVWLIGYSKKKMMTHNFVACLCQKQIWNSHLNILGQWRWFVRFFICELCSIDRKPLSILCTFYKIDINILKNLESWCHPQIFGKYQLQCSQYVCII